MYSILTQSNEDTKLNSIGKPLLGYATAILFCIVAFNATTIRYEKHPNDVWFVGLGSTGDFCAVSLSVFPIYFECANTDDFKSSVDPN